MMFIALSILVLIMVAAFAIQLWRDWKISKELQGRKIMAIYRNVGGTLVEIWRRKENA